MGSKTKEAADTSTPEIEDVPGYGEVVERRHVIRAKIESGLYDERYEVTKRGLKSRHLQMMALGGTIGTGLFVGSGQALSLGGPAFLFVSYIIVSVLVFFIVTAISEVAAYLPVHGGSMSYYACRYVSSSLGFAMGYLYWYSLGILVPYEITAASLVIQYWDPDGHISIAVWITVRPV